MIGHCTIRDSQFSSPPPPKWHSFKEFGHRTGCRSCRKCYLVLFTIYVFCNVRPPAMGNTKICTTFPTKYVGIISCFLLFFFMNGNSLWSSLSNLHARLGISILTVFSDRHDNLEYIQHNIKHWNNANLKKNTTQLEPIKPLHWQW